jgi:hypothetical protein
MGASGWCISPVLRSPFRSAGSLEDMPVTLAEGIPNIGCKGRLWGGTPRASSVWVVIHDSGSEVVGPDEGEGSCGSARRGVVTSA